AGKSVVAGSPRGVNMAKVFLRGLLQKAHVVSPTKGLWIFIDGAVCRNQGVEMRVVGDMQKAAGSLATSFQQARLAVSDKTRLVVSSPGTGKELISSLTAEGIPSKLTGSAVDLGGDAAGATRSQKKFRMRLKSAKLRSNQTQKLRRLHGSHKDWSFPIVGDDAFLGAVLGDFDELLAAFSADVARLGWRKAAAHPHGETLTGGADLQLVQAELNSFAKKGSMDLWGGTLTVVSGG
ncbi:unnamed protein product, partial [Prorocentrum cordatum]